MEVSKNEIQSAYQRIKGHPVPTAINLSAVAKGLAAAYPLRFEFEINRSRGFAWDNDEIR
jgi:hypothetical protein